MKKTLSIFAAVVLLAACRGHRETVTGDYGMGVVTGQVVMASGMANASPAGVRVAVVLLAACRGHRETVTGDYGMGVVSGQIVMASGMVNASPAGVQVVVGGTGMSVVVGADGRFAFAMRRRERISSSSARATA